jgi:hypothetical protein
MPCLVVALGIFTKLGWGLIVNAVLWNSHRLVFRACSVPTILLHAVVTIHVIVSSRVRQSICMCCLTDSSADRNVLCLLSFLLDHCILNLITLVLGEECKFWRLPLSSQLLASYYYVSHRSTYITYIITLFCSILYLCSLRVRVQIP